MEFPVNSSGQPADDMPDDLATSKGPLFGVHELAPDLLETYARLWQFETWMRRLVYVQLRALDGDAWESKIKTQRAKASKANDKRLTHMPTPEDDVLSFAQLSDLINVIAEHRQYFEAYLPPKTIWDAKLEEVMAIRHRVAHFRTLHRDDLARVKQFLRDIDHGLWRFCTGYNHHHSVLPQSGDPVVAHFLPMDPFPWTEVGDKQWARLGSADPAARLSVTVEVLAMPWATWATPIAGKAGLLYDVSIHARGQRSIDYRQFMRETKRLHARVVHLCLDSAASSLRVTIPACLGEDAVKGLIQRFCDAVLNAMRASSGGGPDGKVQAYADTLPEFVLGPDNPLTYLGPGMDCSFFAA